MAHDPAIDTHDDETGIMTADAVRAKQMCRPQQFTRECTGYFNACANGSCYHKNYDGCLCADQDCHKRADKDGKTCEFTCEEGACVDAQCNKGADCVRNKPRECWDRKKVMVHKNQGACVAFRCEYDWQPDSEICANLQTCVDGSCLPDSSWLDALRSSPEELPEFTHRGEPGSWLVLATETLGEFVYAADHHDSWCGEECVAVHGLLLAKNDGSVLLADDGTGAEISRDLRERVMPLILGNRTLRLLVFEWAAPAMKKAFDTLPKGAQDMYLLALRHSLQYLDKTDIAAEQTYLDRLRAKDCEGLPHMSDTLSGMSAEAAEALKCSQWAFIHWNPAGETGPFRKMEAFLFRRATTNGVSIKVLKLYTNRLIKVLSKGR